MDEPRHFEVVCRGCGNVFELSLRLPDGVEPPTRDCYECTECCSDRSVLDLPEEIEKQLEGKTFADRWKIQSVLASTMAHRKGFYVEYPDGTFGYIDGYTPYRKEKVRGTSARWRQNNKKRATEYKRLYRGGYRASEQRQSDPDGYNNRERQLAVDCEAWNARLERLGFACSFCGQLLTQATAIRWPLVPLEDGGADIENLIPICGGCRGKKAAEKKWKKAA